MGAIGLRGACVEGELVDGSLVGWCGGMGKIIWPLLRAESNRTSTAVVVVARFFRAVRPAVVHPPYHGPAFLLTMSLFHVFQLDLT